MASRMANKDPPREHLSRWCVLVWKMVWNDLGKGIKPAVGLEGTWSSADA